MFFSHSHVGLSVASWKLHLPEKGALKIDSKMVVGENDSPLKPTGRNMEDSKLFFSNGSRLRLEDLSQWENGLTLPVTLSRC